MTANTINKMVEIFKNSGALEDEFDKFCILMGVTAIIKERDDQFGIEYVWYKK